MSSINPHFTFHYAQPEEYRFSHDSVFLARTVFELCRERDLAQARVLDLCAGCGIVGLDFLFHLRAAGRELPTAVDFLEVQEIYKPYLEKNAAAFPMTHLYFKNYSQLTEASESSRYDLILCNPPFFRVDQGRLSPSEFKNRCRFFLDADFATLIRAIENALAPNGSAFLLLRDLSEHGINPEQEARDLLGAETHLQTRGDIRGTALIEIRKSAPPHRPT